MASAMLMNTRASAGSRALLGVIVIIAALGLSGCAGAPAPHPAPTATDGIRPADSIVVDGKPVPYEGVQRWSDASVPSRSSRDITLFATGAPNAGGGPCGPPALRVLTAESPSEVRILVADYEQPAPVDLACPAMGFGPSPHPVTLRAPLGDRRLVDVATGTDRPVLDGSRLVNLPGLPSVFGPAVLRREADSSIIVRQWTERASASPAKVTLRSGAPSALSGSGSPYGGLVRQFDVRGVPGTLYRDVGGGAGWTVQWTPSSNETVRLDLSASPHLKWTADEAVRLAQAVTGYRTAAVADRLPPPSTPGTAAVTYSSADGPVRHASNLLKSSGVWIGVICQGAGRVAVSLRGATYATDCTPKLVHRVTKSTGSAFEPFFVDITASKGVRWTVTLARASLDGS